MKRSYQLLVLFLLASSSLFATNEKEKSNELLPPLSGTYTIGGATPDYTTISEAFADLSAMGVEGPTIFEIRDGSYIEQLSLGIISGTNETNTVTFRSENLDSSLVVISFNSPSNANYLLSLNNSDYLTFEHLTFESVSANYGRIIVLIDTVENLTIQNCAFSALDLNDYCIYGDNIENFNTTIQNCVFEGNGYGIHLDGTANGNNRIPGLVIDNNQFFEQNTQAIYTYDHRNPKVRNNHVQSSSNSTTVKIYLNNSYDATEFINNTIDWPNGGAGFYTNTNRTATGPGNAKIIGNTIKIRSNYGMVIYGSANANGTLELTENIVTLSEGQYGIQYYYIAIDANRALVANNHFHVTGTSTKYGFYGYFHSYTDIFHNSIDVKNNGGTTYGFYDNRGRGSDIVNNIVNIIGDGYPLYVVNFYSNVISRIDYNSYYSSDSLFFYRNTTYNGLNAYQTGWNLDSNSIAKPAYFLSDTSFQTAQIAFNNTGLPLDSVTIDIEGEPRDLLTPDIGPDEFTPPPSDAGISKVFPPKAPFPVGEHPIYVALTNFGATPLTSANIRWAVNDSVKSIVPWTGNLSSGDTTHVWIGTDTFDLAEGNEIIAWTENPNGVVDPFFINDTAKINNVYAALSGTYTIGGIDPDFLDFGNAQNTLNYGGVYGEVQFNVRDGVYNEQIYLTEFPGSSVTNTVIFGSENGDSSLVTLTFGNQNSSQSVLTISNSDFLTFENMTFASIDPNYGRVISLIDTVQNLSFLNCAFQAVDIFDYFIYGSNIENENTIIRNCYFKGNGYGVYLYGSANGNNFNKGTIIENNVFENSNYEGIHTFYQRNISVTNNVYTSNSTRTNYKIYLDNSYDSVVCSNNKIILPNGGTGMYVEGLRTATGLGEYIIDSNIIRVNSGTGIVIEGNGNTNGTLRFTNNQINVQNGNYGVQYYFDAVVGNRALFANNYIQVGGSATSYGIYAYQYSYTNIYHNSVNVSNNGTANSYGYWDNRGRLTELVNNAFYVKGNGYPLFVNNFYSNVTQRSDYNSLYSPSGLFYYRNVEYPNLVAYQAGTSLDSNSIYFNPFFINDTSYQVAQVALKSAGTELVEVGTDIEGDSRDTLPDIGADEFILPPVDAGIMSIQIPDVPFPVGNHQVAAVLKNFGSDDLTSVEIPWQVNGVDQTPISWTGALASGDTTIVALGVVSFDLAEGYRFDCKSELPNGSPDVLPVNDSTFIENVYAGLSGNYTLGGDTSDFTSFTNAQNTLNFGGVYGAVQFDIRNGVFNEQIQFNEFPGASLENNIVFRGENGDSSLVTLTFDNQNSSQSVMTISNTDFLTFEDMTFTSIDANYGRVISLIDTIQNITFQNCAFYAVDLNDYFIYGSNIENENTTIQNCYFQGNGYGVYLYGSANGNNFNTGTIIENNFFENSFREGIHTFNQRDIKVNNNTYISNSNRTNYKIYLDNSYDSVEVRNNRVILPDGGTAMYVEGFRTTNGLGNVVVDSNFIEVNTGTGIVLQGSGNDNGTMHFTNNTINVLNGNYGVQYYYNAVANNRALFANNFIHLGGSSTTYGIYAFNHAYTNIYHNTVNVTSLSGTTNAYYDNRGRVSNLVNNIFNIEGQGTPLYVVNFYSNVILNSDHNDFHTTTGNLIYYRNVAYNDLASYQAATMRDSNSVSIEPLFINDTFDLHVTNVLLDKRGTPLPEVTTDIDGDTRDPIRPDIGADEFITAANDVSIIRLDAPKMLFPAGNSEVTVSVLNNGLDTLRNFSIKSEINGETQLPYDWSGEVLSGNSIDSITIGSFQFEIDSAYQLTFITENPNGQEDGYLLDDTLRINNLYAALGGTYTIGGLNPDFESFNHALTALINGGVVDSVIFNVRDGIYNERMALPSIRGASANNTITFQSESANPTNTELRFITANVDSTFAVVLDGADFIRFKNLTLNTTGSIYSRVINFKNGADNNMFVGNEIISTVINTTNGNYDLVIVNSNQLNHGNAFINNHFVGGSDGIYYPSSTSYSTGVRIIGNTFEQQYQRGIYTSYQQDLTIQNNHFSNSAGYSNYRAIEPAASGQDLNIDGNTIVITNGGYGVLLSSYNHQNTMKPAIISNNFMTINGTNNTSAIWVTSSNYVKVLYNTIRINNTATNTYAINLGSGIEHYVYNNICANFGAGQTIYATSINYLEDSDFNDLYSNGNTLATYSNAYTDLGNWQSSTGFDQNSISLDPLFENDSSFFVIEIELNNTGTPVDEVVSDIEGDPRDLNNPDIGADEYTPIIPDDIGIIEIISPNKNVPFSGVDEEIIVILRNNGSNNINTATINSIIDGVNQFPYNWSGTLLPGQRDTVMIGTTNLSFNISHQITSYSSAPNGVIDNTPSNDTTKADELYAGLIGIYTVGGVLPNFNTINEAVTIMNNGGVLGAVELRLRNGNYNEQLLLEKVEGVSPTNTVTFTSESGDPSLVTIEYSGTSQKQFTIRLNNTDWMIFEKMTLQSNHQSYGSVAYIQGGSANNIFRENLIQANSGTNDALIYSPSSSSDNDNHFFDNTFLKGGRGIDMRGSNNSNQQAGIRIENNHFIDQNSESIYLNDHRGPKVLNNMVGFLERNPNSISIQLYDSDGLVQVENNIINRSNGSGIVLQFCNSLNSLEKGRIVNNVIAIGGSSNINGMYLNSCSLFDIYHNSVHLYNTNTSSKAFRDGSNSNNKTLNNIFANTGGGYAYYHTSSLTSSSDYNNIYTTGTNLGYWVNANITDLASWQLASSQDANAVSVNPLFFSDANLHVLQVGLDGVATVIPEVTEDFEGDMRSPTTPDIGADEFDFITDDIGIIEVTGVMNGCALTNMEQPTFVIQNYGGLSQTGFDIEVILNGAPAIVENVGSAIVPPGDTIHYTMSTPLDLSSIQVHLVDISTNLVGDLNPDNNSISLQAQNYQVPDAPTNLLPGEGQMNVSKPINLSWLPSDGATLYDLFIWADTLPQPASPYFANLSQISAVINTSAFVFGVTYSWQVVAKNPFCQTPSQIQSFTLRELPDLISSNIQVPVAPFSSQTISVSWNVDNIGVGATLDETWYDQVYLSQDEIFSTNVDIYLGAIANLSALAPTDSYAHTLNVTLPQGISGTWYLFVRTNGYNSIPESNTSNNPNSTPINISLTPPPDLQVTSVIPPNNAFSGTEITVSYTVTNEGNGDTEENSWRDYFYISDQLQFNLNDALFLDQTTHSGQLLGGASYTSAKILEIPDEIFGEYFIHVFTDRQSQVYEFAFEDNNVGSSDTMQIFLTPPPDMELTSYIIPDTLSPSQKINAIYTVTNVGATAAVGNWRDRIYISPIDSFDASAVNLRTINKGSILNAGFDYLSAGQITIPANYNGDYYLYFRTDYQNSIFEFNSEANNILRTGIIAVVPPDLQVSDISSPVNGLSGEPVALTWNTKNESRGKVFNKPVVDAVYLSAFPNFDESAAKIGTLAYNVTLNEQSASAKEMNAVLPNGISGVHYLHIKTDDTEKIFEGINEDNNVSSVTINVALSPSPDLQVSAFGPLPDTALTIVSIVPVSFTVSNEGGASAKGSAWKEMLYMSTDSIWNDTSPNNFLLEEAERFTQLENGNSYELNYGIAFPMVEQLVPDRDSFTFYLYAVTDFEDNIYEHEALNENNVLRSDPIYLICPTETDLRITNLSTIPSDTLETSQDLLLSWTVDNIGSSTEIWGYDIWYDGVYLSNDPTWDPDDLLIEDFTQEGPLDSLEYYSDEKTITIPEVPSGHYCLMLVADNQEYLDEESKENNDAIFPVAGVATNVYIRQKPPSNLVVKTFTAPVDGISGQPIDVIVKVKNEGVGEVDEDWVDKVYLSTDFTISNSDEILYTNVNKPTLTPGEEYLDTIQVFLPINKEGNFILLFKTDANNRIFEMGQEGDNSLFTFITLNRDDPSDLIVDNATIPTSVFVNQKIDIDFNVKNIGQFPAGGFQRDIIYLSKDSIFDVGDVQLGLQQLTSQLAPGANESRTIEMVCTPGVPLGNYHVVIQTDALNNIYEVSDENNVYISPGKINIQVEELPMDVLTANNLLHQRSIFYRIEIPDTLDDETMQVTLISNKPLASNELYLSLDEMPTRSTHDFSHSIPFNPNQKVVVPELDGGTYYVHAYGESNVSEPQDVSIIAQIIEFSIVAVNKNVAGNTGTMTARITGAKFTETMEVRIEDDALGEHIATKLFFINSTEVFASFNLAGAELGIYDVVIEKPGGEMTSLEDGFTIIEGPVVSVDAFGPDESGFTCNIKNLGTENLLSSNIIAPSSVRVGRLVPITIQFGNNGSMDIPCPQRFILSVRGAPLGFSPEEIPEMKQELLLVFEEPGGPPGILRPGATGSMTIYTFSSHPLRFYIQE